MFALALVFATQLAAVSHGGTGDGAEPDIDGADIFVGASAAVCAVVGGVVGFSQFSATDEFFPLKVMASSGAGAALGGGVAAFFIGRFLDAPFVAAAAAFGVPFGLYGLYLLASPLLIAGMVAASAVLYQEYGPAGSSSTNASDLNLAPALFAGGAALLGLGAAVGAAGGAVAGLKVRVQVFGDDSDAGDDRAGNAAADDNVAEGSAADEINAADGDG